MFLLNAVVAFGLNMAVFMLIGKTSALTMNIGGVVKDWLLIGLSYWIYSYVCLVLLLENDDCWVLSLSESCQWFDGPRHPI